MFLVSCDEIVIVCAVGQYGPGNDRFLLLLSKEGVEIATEGEAESEPKYPISHGPDPDLFFGRD